MILSFSRGLMESFRLLISKLTIGSIPLNINAGKISHFMVGKVGFCTQLPFSLILGFDWQQQVQARCIYDFNGSLSISTPSALHLFEYMQTSRPSSSCITSNQPSLQPCR
ncbi:hypothetical protein AVEN_228235-1 [Araneus ventricosus]|uniref:Uncharacterized protein n=1 Tax=Araneus ventricosus TaxID=182803 RepID=A0A4Y2GAR2_ARAVE|nr:hypothetical protein AVEN_228235-1 [Araneus ventricosus]